MSYPHKQAFDLKSAIAATAERQRNGVNPSKNLAARKKDHAVMVGKNKIGDGHREANGYPCPGSNKK